jgi:tetratricopeptide (TPR) repeat protein
VLLARAYANAGIRLCYEKLEAYRRARSLLETVIEVDSSNADALATLSLLMLFFVGSRSTARDAAERALSVGARSPLAHVAAVWERLSRRDFSAALTQADLAIASTPDSATATSLVGTVLYMSGQYWEARDAFGGALAITEGESTALYYAACTETILGNEVAANGLLGRICDAHICSRVISLRGYLAAKRGNRVVAEKAVSDLATLQYPSDVALSIVLLAMGREEEAARALTRALSNCEPGLFLSAVDPIYEPLWETFSDLFGRISAERKPQCDACGDVLSVPCTQPLHRRSLCWNCRQAHRVSE